MAPIRGRHPSVELPILWKPGEHVAIVGDTGTGKTYLVQKLSELRKYVVMLRTKPDDIEFPGFEKTRHAELMNQWNGERILLAPKLSQQPQEIWLALKLAWEHGGWTVIVDEFWYAERRLGLREHIENLLTQGRSKKITMVVGMQRPAWVSRFGIAEATHIFVFRTEGKDTKSIMESTTPRMKEALESLDGHDFAYYNRAKRIIQVGNANNLAAIFRNQAPNPLTRSR